MKPGDIATLLLTGGTTGVPKCAETTYSEYVAAALQVRAWLGPALEEWKSPIMIPLPLFHIYANVGRAGARLRDAQSARARAQSARPRGRAQDDPAHEARLLLRRAHALQRAAQPPDGQGGEDRLQLDEGLHQRRLAAHGRDEETLRGAHRRTDLRGLRAHRERDGRRLQSDRRREQAGLGGDAPPRCRAARSSTPESGDKELGHRERSARSSCVRRTS